VLVGFEKEIGMSEPDFLDISRKAHELVSAHGGWNAYTFADGQAKRALGADEIAEHDFWLAVAMSLKPR
jgi:hypothetical protein